MERLAQCGQHLTEFPVTEQHLPDHLSALQHTGSFLLLEVTIVEQLVWEIRAPKVKTAEPPFINERQYIFIDFTLSAIILEQVHDPLSQCLSSAQTL